MASKRNQKNRSNAEPTASPTLPFCLSKARLDPVACRKLVSSRVWEELVMQPIMERNKASGCIMAIDDPERYLSWLDEASLENAYTVAAYLSKLFKNLKKIMLEDHERGGDIEEVWMRLTYEERENHVLEAFDNAVDCTGGVFDNCRLLCPDVSIASLAHNNGKGLLHLFRYILQTPSAFPDSHEYYPVISEDFDKRYGITRDGTGPPLHRAVRCAQTETQNNRHLFLGQFFMSILHQGYKTYRSGVTVEKPRLPIKLDPLLVRRTHMGESTVNERTEELKHIYRQGSRNKEAVANQELDTMYEIAREARGKEACLCCQRLVEEVQELVSSGRSFMYCARCLKIGRKAPYCSADCQRQHYKALGDHHIYCGKYFVDLARPLNGWATPPTLPPLSIALQFQLCQKDLQPRTYPKAIYHFRYYNKSEPPYPKNPSNPPIWYARECRTSGIMDTDLRLEECLERAATGRKEEDIKQFILSVYFFMNQDPDLAPGLTKQFAAEWDLDIEKLEGWIRSAELAKWLEDLRVNVGEKRKLLGTTEGDA